jgi:tetratricopeptide (TPR) repeat protein
LPRDFDIFINYRDADARFGAAATYELLAGRFDRSRMFLDNQSMGPGSVYPEQINAALESTRVLVVLIGPAWLIDTDGTQPPIHRETDWVRREIRRAIERAIPIVPVLLDGTSLPDPQLLPADIRSLVHRQATSVRHHTLGVDVRRLADHLADVVRGVPAGVPRELPASTAYFTGRDAELDLLDAALSEAGDRTPPIAVLSGTAGVGKTALAVRWAHRTVAGFPDGQLYVDLRGFGPGEPVTPMAALSGFLRALGVERPEELAGLAERAARFRTIVSGRRMVVVLDNANSARHVEPLLPGTGSTVVVVTSRDLLGELQIRHGARLVRLAALPAEAGVELLTAAVGDRATGETVAAHRLALLCEGLPLALRIVAERLVSQPALTFAALVAELADEQSRLRALSSRSETISMRAVFSWSYHQLADAEAAVFRAIGVGPRRGFDAATIAAVAGRPVGPELVRLARAHLVSELDNGRYTAHDLLRAYAYEVAREAGEPSPDEAARRLFDHYLRSAEHADRILTPHRTRIELVADPDAGVNFPDAAAALRWLRTEEPNLVALSELDNPELDIHRWQLAYVLRTYFYLTKQLDGWIDTHGNALKAAQRRGDIRAEALTRNNLGMAMAAIGRLDEATNHFRVAQELFEGLGEQLGVSNSLANIASVLRRRNEPGKALTYQREALTYYRGAAQLSHIGITLRGMAGAHLELGEAAEAVLCAQEAVDIATWLSYELDIAQANNTLGTA